MLSLSFLLLSAIAPVFAAPNPRADAQNIQISWLKNIASGATSLTVTSQDSTQVYGESCSNDISIGDVPISVDANDKGRGTISIAGNVHEIRYDEEGTGAVSCERAYNGKTVEVDCTVPWTSTLPGKFEGGADCFNGTAPAKLGHRSMPLAGSGLDARDLETRQLYQCPWGQEWRLVGDGNIKDRRYAHQLTNKMTCDGKNSCSIQHEEGKSFTIGFEASAQVARWFGIGFGVQESISVAETKVCDGEGTDTVCVWWTQPYKEYTAQEWALPPRTGGCYGREYARGDPVTFRSPIADAGEPYCVVGHCRNRGDGYWSH